MPTMNMLSQAKQFFDLHRSWLGEGARPVPTPQAQDRANVCLACPNNVEKPIEEFFKGAAALPVKRMIAYKNKMNLRVNGEKSLHLCDACGCALRLKVHVPLKTILETTDASTLPKHCWIVTEQKEPK